MGSEATDSKSREARKGFSLRWSNWSYTTRVAAAFALIAAMTALVAIGVVSLVWQYHFDTYTRENMQTVADSAAEQIAVRYGETKTFNSYTLQPAEYMVSVNAGVGMQVVTADSATVFDSTELLSSEETERYALPSLAPREDSNSVARATIVVDGEAVGTVRVWVYGSEGLLRSTDIQFRNQSYSALAWASVVAIILATIIGYVFARNLVRPIKRMTDTAEAIKKGDLTARTGLSGDDEVARLGKTFDAMADSVERDRKLERRLTTDVAHELRTPLMAIRSTVEAMVDGVFPADEEHLVTVNSEVQRLSRLVDSLLKLSRLENRSNPTKREIVNVGELIQGIIITHETYVAESGLTLEYEAEENVVVKGDADMIRQATANLISNSVRYTPEGGSIKVHVYRDSGMAAIAVKDTGIGLTPEEARMVFSRFWRADAGRDRASGGLGIGLSVVKEIVDRHDGWVQVEGKKNEGACFTIHIPLYREAEADRSPKVTGRLPLGRK